MPSLISDFWTYCSCYEINRNHAIWAALGLLGSTVNRRIYIKCGDLKHHANLYICLVAEQGNKKSTCNDWARDFFVEACPDIPIASSVQSREQIVQFMASDEDVRTFEDHEKTLIEYHPFMMFINEFEQFLSFNTPGMLSFLVDIYDRSYYDAGTIKRGLEKFPNPSVNIIACCTPQWLIDKLKGNIITGGICRRMVFVYEDDAKNEDGSLVCIPTPELTPEAIAAKDRIRSHLKTLVKLSGQYHFDPIAKAWFDCWYKQNKIDLQNTTDPFLRGFRRSMDVQLLKVVMLLGIASPDPKFLITRPLLEEGRAILESIMPNMSRLSIAAGRNPLAQPQQELLEYVRSQGGMVTEKQLLRQDSNLSPMEIFNVVRHLKTSGRLIEVSEPIPNTSPPQYRKWLLTETKHNELQRKKSLATVTTSK